MYFLLSSVKDYRDNHLEKKLEIKLHDSQKLGFTIWNLSSLCSFYDVQLYLFKNLVNRVYFIKKAPTVYYDPPDRSKAKLLKYYSIGKKGFNKLPEGLNPIYTTSKYRTYGLVLTDFKTSDDYMDIWNLLDYREDPLYFAVNKMTNIVYRKPSEPFFKNRVRKIVAVGTFMYPYIIHLK